MWMFKCWIKVDAYDSSAGGVLVPGDMIRPVVSTLGLTLYITYIAIEIYSS